MGKHSEWFRKVPQRLHEDFLLVPQLFSLRTCLTGKAPQGSSRFRKVSQQFHEGRQIKFKESTGKQKKAEESREAEEAKDAEAANAAYRAEAATPAARPKAAVAAPRQRPEHAEEVYEGEAAAGPEGGSEEEARGPRGRERSAPPRSGVSSATGRRTCHTLSSWPLELAYQLMPASRVPSFLATQCRTSVKIKRSTSRTSLRVGPSSSPAGSS